MGRLCFWLEWFGMIAGLDLDVWVGSALVAARCVEPEALGCGGAGRCWAWTEPVAM